MRSGSTPEKTRLLNRRIIKIMAVLTNNKILVNMQSKMLRQRLEYKRMLFRRLLLPMDSRRMRMLHPLLSTRR
jgi:hypothetical protein